MGLLNPCSGKFENSEIKLRKVTKNDIKKIYEWRNHPEVRKWMFNSKEISWKEHVRFWEEYLKDNNKYAFIIVNRNDECGIVRIEKIRDDIYEVGIIVAPSFQGRGIGTKALKKVLNMFKNKKFIAKVKPENIASVCLFTKLGFRESFIQFELDCRDDIHENHKNRR